MLLTIIAVCVVGAVAARGVIVLHGRRKGRGYVSSPVAVVLFAAALGMWCALAVSPDGAVVAFVPLLSMWAVAVDVDLRSSLLPDLLTLGGAGWFLAAAVWFPAGRRAILAGALTATVFLVLALVAPSSYGLGDVKLGLSTGAVAGWFGGWPALLAATLAFIGLSLVGVVIAVLRRRRLREVELPFGPFLVVGALTAPWLWPPPAVSQGSILEGEVGMSWTTIAASAGLLLTLLILAWAVTRPRMAGTLTIHGVGVDRQFLLTGRALEIRVDGLTATVKATRDPDRVRISGVGVGGNRRRIVLRDGHTRRVAGHPMTFTSRGARIDHQLRFGHHPAGDGLGGGLTPAG